MRAGVIVAGGYSTRFSDGDKAVATIDGTPMVRLVADRIAPAIETLVVNGRLEQFDAFAQAMDGYPLPVDYVQDPEPGGGPVAGIANGLEALSNDVTAAFVVACDMPYVDVVVVEALFERFDQSAAQAVVPRSDDGWYQVLHAVYEPEPMVNACRRALIDGERKVLAPLEHLTVTGFEVTDESTFENINTTSALQRARERFSSAATDPDS